MRVLCPLLTAVLICWAVSAAAAEPEVAEIEIRGARIVDEAMIRLQINSKQGEPLNSETVEEDIKDIYRTGFFKTVAASRRQSEEGEVLLFIVEEKPAIRSVSLQGNDEVSDDDFKDALNLGTRRFYDEHRIHNAVADVKELYENKGLYGTEIETEVGPIEEGYVDLTFHITEGEKKLIRRVVFEGNSDMDDDDLQDEIETIRYKWWSSWIFGTGAIKKDYLKNDVLLLKQFYLNRGYIDVRITDPEIRELEDGLEVAFKISEGSVYTVGAVSASGTLLDGGEEETLEDIELETGEVFSVEKLRKDTFLVSDKFTDIGYAFVNVDRVTDIDRESKTVDVEFTIDKGELIHIARIETTGNRKTSDNVVRRTMKLQEGDLFSSSKIKRSQELLQRLGYFDEVTITPDPALELNEVNLDVSVREGATGSFSAGAGVSSGEGFIFTTRISENNIFGTGNSISLSMNAGTRQENFVIGFKNPRVYDTHWSFGTELLAVQREFDDFDRDQMGGAVSVGYPLWFWDEKHFDDVRFGLRYSLLEVKIRNIDDDAPQLVQDEAGTSLSSSITPSIVRNTVDNPLDPTKGSLQALSVEVAGLGGDEEFWLVKARNSMYFPLFDVASSKVVFAHRTKFGWGETYNDETFPLFRRFFPGGINSVRGYESRELGPKDEEGNEFGGNKQLVSNFEIIFPLLEAAGFKGVVFYDIGNAFDDDDDMELGELRQAVGWGIRWRSPIAPIRIEIGYPLDKEEGDQSMVTNFSFGAPL